MKFIEREKGYPVRFLKVFGIEIFRWEYVKKESVYYRNVLYGLISTTMFTCFEKCSSEKTVKLLNIPVLKRTDDGEYIKLYFFNKILIKTSSKTDLIKKIYKNCFNAGFDAIFLIICNSGEPYLFFKHILEPFIKKQGIKNPVVVCRKKYHVYLLKAFCPDISCILMDFPECYIKYNPCIIDGVQLRVVMHPAYFKKLENLTLSGSDLHYFDSMLADFDLTRNEIFDNKLITSVDDEISAEKKVKKTGLNMEKFVFISPESCSCRNNDSKYWSDIIRHYQGLGYDIYVNIVLNTLNLSSVSYKTCFLTFPEALALAKKAKKIIGSRSGFIEYLTQSGTEIDVIYAPFYSNTNEVSLTAKQVKIAYTINKLPFLNSKVNEFLKEEYIKYLKNNVV